MRKNVLLNHHFLHNLILKPPVMGLKLFGIDIDGGMLYSYIKNGNRRG